MYNLVNINNYRDEVGKYHVQVCTTTPCMLRDAYPVLDAIKKETKEINSKCGKELFTVGEIECSGACVNAPVMSVDIGYDEKITNADSRNQPGDYYEDLTPESAVRIIRELAEGKLPKTGPQIRGRTSCEPEGGETVLNNVPGSIERPPYKLREDIEFLN